MTVETTETVAGPFEGNDVAKTFEFDWRIDTKDEVAVYQLAPDGVETLLEVDVDYTVDVSGKSITLPAALPTGYILKIISNFTPNQLTDFASQGAFYPVVHEDAFDKVTYLVQQIFEELERTLRVAVTDDSGGLVLPSPMPFNRLGWNHDGTAIINFASTEALIIAQASAPSHLDYQLWYDTEASTLRYWDGTGWTGSAPTVEWILLQLAGQLDSSHLVQSLNDEINSISTLADEIGLLQTQVAALEGTPAWDTNDSYTIDDTVTYNGGLYRCIADTAAPSAIPTDTNYWVKIGDYASIGDAVSAIAADLDDVELVVYDEVDGVGANAARIDALQASVDNPTTGLASKAAVTYVDAAIADETQARSTAISQVTAAYEAGDETLSTAIQTEADARVSADGLLSAEYTIKVQARAADGKLGVAGFGLAVENDASGTMTSEAAIMADRFYIIDPDGSGTAAPFAVIDGTVFMNTAMIKDGTINTAKIADVIESTNYTGTTGWRISKSGAIEANQITIRDNAGNIILQSGGQINWDGIDFTGGSVTDLDYTGDLNATEGATWLSNIDFTGGSVTDLDYTGDLNATEGAAWGTNVSDIPYGSIYSNDDATASGFNPTFSDWPDGSTFPTDWTGWSWGSSLVSRDASTVRVGEYSIKFVCDGVLQGGATIAKSFTPWLKTGTFVIGSIDIKYGGDGTQGKPSILIDQYRNGNGYESAGRTTIIGSDDLSYTGWQRLTFVANKWPDDQMSGMRIYLMGAFSAPYYDGTVWFDNLTFTFVEAGLANSNITIGSNGAISGAGGGQVTIGGLGFTGDLNADVTANNTAAAIANQGNFATLDQIDSDNVSTYIASAAIQDAQIANLNANKINAGTIGAAYIGAGSINAGHIAANAVSTSELAAGAITAGSGIIDDLAVDTLQIADQAITIPSAATRTTTLSNTNGDYLTLDITSSGAPVFVSAVAHMYNYTIAQSVPSGTIYAKLYREKPAGSNRTLLRELSSSGMKYPTAIFNVSETPGAGGVRYIIEFTHPSGADNGGSMTFGSIFALETKK